MYYTLKILAHGFPTGIRMLDGKATDALEASSLSFNSQLINIYSNCWGPKDDGKTFGKPGPLAAKSLQEGAEKVRSVDSLRVST